MPFERSPLFSFASDKIQQEVKRRFAQSDFGRLIEVVERTYDRPASQAAIEKILRQWKGANAERTLRQLMGADFGSLVRTVEKYARGGGSGGLGKRLLMQFLKSLGPAGNILKSLATATKSPAGYRSSLNDAMALIRAMGGEVIPGKEWGTVQDVERSVRAMEKRLEEMRARGEQVETKPPTREQKRLQEGPRSLDIPMAGGGSRKFPPDHPIITGDMVPTPGSTNVYEFGYDAERACLYVRFKLGMAPREHVRPNAPGSLYRYGGVTPEEFLSLYKVRNHSADGGGPGDWVWDNLRERGTVSGHKKPYELAGVMGGYVPRQARVLRNQQTGQLEEWFIPRLVPTTGGKWLRSRKPAELAPTSGFMVGERGAGGGPRSGRNSPLG